MYDVVNPDQSIEIHSYKKVGVGILTFNNWCVAYRTEDAAEKDFLVHDGTLGIGL